MLGGDNLENELLKVAASQGIWAILSVLLISYILKSQIEREKKHEEREKNYHSILIKLIEKIDIIEGINKSVKRNRIRKSRNKE